MSPQRVQLSRRRGYRKPEGAIVVARPSKWGNPFRLGTRSALARMPSVDTPGKEWEYEGRISAAGMRHDYHHPDGRIAICNIRQMTAQETVDCYRALLNGGGWPLNFIHQGGYYRTATEARAELAGYDLACWCPLDQPCHADVLLEIANGGVL